MGEAPGDAAKARALFEEIEPKLEKDPALARRVAAALHKALAPPKTSNRRAKAVLDPTAVFREDPAHLRSALGALTVDQLKDIVSQYAMDPRRLALKWKSEEKLVDLIVSITEQRARKGDAFRA